jgi:hypothetical protein
MREFVLWWDAQEKQAGSLKRGKTLSRRIRSETPEAGKDGLPDRLTIHRWRSKVAEEEDFAGIDAPRWPRTRDLGPGEGAGRRDRGSQSRSHTAAPIARSRRASAAKSSPWFASGPTATWIISWSNVRGISSSVSQ